MKAALVSGAGGFVGSHVVAELRDNGIRVCALVHSPVPEENRLEGVDYVSFDLAKSDELLSCVERGVFDTFFHFAWNGASGDKRFDTRLQLDNAQWTIDTMRVAAELGCTRFIGAGSIMENEIIAATAQDGNKPGLGYVYGGGKVIAHIMASSVAADIGIDLVWTKITNAYGPGELSPRMLNTTVRKVIEHKPLQFTAATQNYDFVYIDDVARAYRLIGEKGKPFSEYLIGSSQARPLKEFLLELRDAIAQDRELVFGDVPFTGVDLDLADFSCEKTEADTGFRAEVSFAEGVRRTRDWIVRMERSSGDAAL